VEQIWGKLPQCNTETWKTGRSFQLLTVLSSFGFGYCVPRRIDHPYRENGEKFDRFLGAMLEEDLLCKDSAPIADLFPTGQEKSTVALTYFVPGAMHGSHAEHGDIASDRAKVLGTAR
jgi:hypothetical protein